jgi:uncharacterized protein YwqG
MKIPSELKPFERKAWKPIVEDGDGSPINSKFAGTPFLKQDEEYPLCLNCNKPMQLFLQLNLNELPEPVRKEFGQGILQLFYCINEEPFCEVDCEAFFPFAKSVLARIIESENIIALFKETSVESAFPPKIITGWKETEDYFNWDEGESLGIELDEDVWDELSEVGYPVGGDKLAGYPMWVQGIEYPNCSVCGEQMRLLFQIDSEDNLPYMFGDVGCGHLTQCKTHKDQLAFGWACA